MFSRKLHHEGLIQFRIPLFHRCYLTSRVTLWYLQRYILDLLCHISDLFSHIYSCQGISRTLAYLGTFYLRHILNATHNIQADASIFRFPTYSSTLCFRHIQLYLQGRYIEAYFFKFGYILADSGIFRILPQLDVFMYIEAYFNRLRHIQNF